MVYCIVARRVLRPPRTVVSHPFVRHKSLIAAIERGKVPTRGPDLYGDSRARKEWNRINRSDRNDAPEHHEGGARWMGRGRVADRLNYTHGEVLAEDPTIDLYSRLTKAGKPVRRVRHQREFNSPSELGPGPRSLQYTTAASEFVYGYSSVVAVIKANRRQMYRLYMTPAVKTNRPEIMDIIKDQNLSSIVEEVSPSYTYAMTNASKGRPHNGIILEASPLPIPPITELKNVELGEESFSVGIDKQSAEDLAVNGNQELYSYPSAGWRYPLVLFIQGVVDQGNLGAIVRSAYFLGVDAVITSESAIAPWGAITVKASAGAAEAITLFKARDLAGFLGKSSKAGWKIYASNAFDIAPKAMPSTQPNQEDNGKIVYNIARKNKSLPSDHCPVKHHPTILLLGSEGKGIPRNLLPFAHYNVGIPRVRDVAEIQVDSMNVSDAASIICYEMLRKPIPQRARDGEVDLF